MLKIAYPFHGYITLVIKSWRAVIKSLGPDHQCVDTGSTPYQFMKLYHDTGQVT